MVYTARKSQRGFDMVMFERKVGGGHVAIFVDTKDSEPGSTRLVGSYELRKKWNKCLKWFEQKSDLKISLNMTSKDCFLVLASLRLVDATAMQKRESRDPNSHIIVLGRQELTRLYTPTFIVGLPRLILSDKLVREVDSDVDEASWCCQCLPVPAACHCTR